MVTKQVWKHFDKQGVLEYQTNHKSVTLSYFYPDGKIRAAGPYTISFSRIEPNGIWKFYYENGNCECKGKYYNALKYGKWKHYDTNRAFMKKTKHRKYTANYNYNFRGL